MPITPAVPILSVCACASRAPGIAAAASTSPSSTMKVNGAARIDRILWARAAPVGRRRRRERGSEAHARERNRV